MNKNDERKALKDDELESASGGFKRPNPEFFQVTTDPKLIQELKEHSHEKRVEQPWKRR